MAIRKKYLKEYILDVMSLVNYQAYSKADVARNLAVNPGLLGKLTKKMAWYIEGMEY